MLTDAILSTLAVLIPTMCMLSLVAVACECEMQEPSSVYTLHYDEEEQAWCITLVGEPGNPKIYCATKEKADNVLDWLENRKEKP